MQPGNRAHPAALRRIGLAGEAAPGIDPCGALQVHVDLPAGETRSVHFILGQGDTREAALALARSGERAYSTKLADSLARSRPRDTLHQGFWLPTIRAVIALGQNDAVRAIENFSRRQKARYR